jgi:hypothetical protein
MRSVEFKELPEIVVDEDYEGLLSSYLEPNACRKIIFPECLDPKKTNVELVDDEARIFPRS